MESRPHLNNLVSVWCLRSPSPAVHMLLNVLCRVYNDAAVKLSQPRVASCSTMHAPAEWFVCSPPPTPTAAAKLEGGRPEAAAGAAQCWHVAGLVGRERVDASDAMYPRVEQSRSKAAAPLKRRADWRQWRRQRRHHRGGTGRGGTGRGGTARLEALSCFYAALMPAGAPARS